MSRKALRHLGDVIVDVAFRKHRAARARRAGSPVATPPPKEVFAEACAELASELEKDGFRYAKSGPHATQRSAGLIHTIFFGTSHHNVRGEHVALELAAGVRSPGLKRWRLLRAHPYRETDTVAGGMIHLLGTEHAYLQWDLADPGTRRETIADVLAAIREVILPWFDHFRDPAETARESAEGWIPEFGLADSVEFALCFGTREQAQQILDRFGRRRPDLIEPAVEAYEKFRSDGMPGRIVSEYAQQVAWVRLEYGLD